VTASTFETKEGSAAFSTFLSFGALDLIAETIKARIIRGLRDARVLVTGNTDLASSDAIYREVESGLDGLTTSARGLLDSLGDAGTTRTFLPAGLTTVLGAVAGAVPGVLSLFSAQRTLITGKTTVDDLAAMAAVVSALNNDRNDDELTLVLDDFRLVPDGRILAALKGLNAERQRLAEKKVRLGHEHEGAEAALLEARREEERLSSAAESKPPEVASARQVVKERQQAVEAIDVRISLVDGMLTSIDAFTAAIGKVPEGARRSALATAALHEQLHPAAKASDGTQPPGFTHVLLVKTQPGGSQQLNDNKPFFMADRFSTLVDVSVTYVLIKTEGSQVVASGTVTRIARAWGKIGDRPEFDLTEG
jgi:hypothetical protein